MTVESKAMDHIRKVLEQFGNKYFASNGALKRTTVIEDLDNYDKDLMTALLSDDLLHKTYTSKIAGVEIFEINKFVDMLKYKEYWADSFTKFDNKIGLTVGGKYIDDSEDVVLDFPYKDTVLKAGMTKEDVEHSGDADESFLNETLAKPEIDELLEPKILVNATKYDKSGTHRANSIKNDDSLILKGNNLIALYSLKSRFTEKVKLVYLDPPYNTKSDSFKYNDKFSNSAWLTFMKNRLEIARDFLTTDGSIFVQIDDNEMPYLKVLMDEIFGKDNFIGNIIWKKKTGSSDTTSIAIVTEYILVYAKNNAEVTFSKNPDSYDKKRYRYTDEYVDRRGPFYYDTLDRGGLQYSDSLNYGVTAPDGSVLYPHGRHEYVNDGWIWKWSKDKVKWGLENGFCQFIKTGDKYKLKYKVYLNVNNKDEIIKRNAPWKNIIEGIMNTNATSEINKLFGNKAFDTPKPEALLKFIINLGTFEEDRVMDFFMGSSTTQAVAMKMDRHFIGVDQMDYVDTISVPRLQMVINGEQGGISKDVNWKGGGSFIYAKLMPKNQNFVKEIQEAENIETLFKIFYRMKQEADIDFRVDLDKFERSISEPGTPIFLQECKRELIRILDKNQLYYNYADIDDADVRIKLSDNDYQFNKSFYSLNESGEE